jgi:hypothetical protein
VRFPVQSLLSVSHRDSAQFAFITSIRTKFALSSRPLNIMLEIILDLEPSALSVLPSFQRKRRRSSSAHTISSGPSAGALENGIAAQFEAEIIAVRSRKAALFVVERICA